MYIYIYIYIYFKYLQYSWTKTDAGFILSKLKIIKQKISLLYSEN